MNIKNIKKDNVEEINKMLDQISNRGMGLIAGTMKKPIFKEALKSPEYHQALNKLLHRIEREKTGSAENIRYVLKEGVEPQMKEYLGLVDKEQYIYYTCLVSACMADLITNNDWVNLEKIDAYNRFCTVPCHIEVIKELFKCTEKYFVRINEIETYTDMRCQIHEVKRYADRMVSLFEEII